MFGLFNGENSWFPTFEDKTRRVAERFFLIQWGVYKINKLLENNHRIFVRFWTMSTMRPTRYNNTY